MLTASTARTEIQVRSNRLEYVPSELTFYVDAARVEFEGFGDETRAVWVESEATGRVERFRYVARASSDAEAVYVNAATRLTLVVRLARPW